jgi:hypothetical protein
MNSLFQNLENGNLTSARQQARAYSLRRLLRYCETHALPVQAALYVKGQCSFQNYCDAS